MFGSSNPFGQSSSGSPFGSQPVFGQQNNANNNPFAPKPFGSTSPFGAQTGGSIFGSNSTGVFGATQASSPLGSTTAFGASSSPAFGAASTPAFGASSTSAFGSSVFGQKPAFGGFGSTPTQSSPFGFQASQPAFGNSVFGSSTAFGAPSQSAFGASSTPAFGASSSPAFGATNTSAFGSTGFGATSPSMFGSSSTPAFGASSTPAFGASSTPAFGASSTPSFSFGASPAFGQSTSAFGSSPFGAAPSAFGSQSSPFGAQATTPTFGNTNFGQQQAFGGQRGGSRIASYTPTTETDVAAGAQAGKLESISAMPVYKDKSHEELRWEDYQLGDKGGPNPAGQSQTTGVVGFGSSPTSSNPFATSSPFGQTSSSPFSTPVASNPFSTPSSTNPFTANSQPFGTSGFGTPTTTTFNSSPFGATSSTSPSLFGSSTPAFGAGTSTSMFGASASSAFGSSPSLFGSASTQGSTPAFNGGFGNTQSSPLFQSNASLLGQTSAFGQTNSAFGQTGSSPFGQTSGSLFGQTSGSTFGQTSSAFGQPSLFNTPSTGFSGNLFASAPSTTSNPMGFGQTTSSFSTPFQTGQPTRSNSLGFGNLGQTQTGSSTFGGTSTLFGQSAFGQTPAAQSVAVPQPAPMTNPFGTLPAMPQLSIGRTVASPSIQYGISSMPVVEKPAPVRVSSLLTPRHLSQRRLRLPARKYHPQNEASKVPFFENEEETPGTPKADALFVRRENPRALVIQPMEHRSVRGHSERASPLKERDSSRHNEGKTADEAQYNGHAAGGKDENGVSNGHVPERTDTAKSGPKTNGINYPTVNGESHRSLSGRKAGEGPIVYEHGTGVESSMPKLRSPDYYTQPSVQELAAKERAEPGFCSRVKDFVVGRRGYGSIKFLGETDVRGLDLESLIQFNNKEVIVYMDENQKPPVGQGLNKAAEVTLLNIKWIDKKTGQPYTEGPIVEKYRELLKKKAANQGAEFVRYNPADGEWVFRVSHFSSYMLGDEDEDVDFCA